MKPIKNKMDYFEFKHKIETAINIGFSCEALDKETEIFVLSEISSNSLYKQLREFVKQQ